MAIQTATKRTTMATAYSSDITHIALATTAPGSSAGTEVSGGSPAYARKASNWGTAAASVIVASPAAHDVPSGTTVVGINMMSAISAGTYLDGASVTSQAFASQGTYQVVATYTQT
jgi:hypothetical protein